MSDSKHYRQRIPTTTEVRKAFAAQYWESVGDYKEGESYFDQWLLKEKAEFAREQFAPMIKFVAEDILGPLYKNNEGDNQ